MIRFHVGPKVLKPKIDPRCVCRKPLYVSIPSGEHIHSCPIHPEFAPYGNILIS